MRIATFNVLHGRSVDDGRVEAGRLSDAVKALDADVLALQEVDRNQPRSHGADLTALAARAMGAVAARFVPALTGTPGGAWTVATGEEHPDSPGYGVALLSRYPVLSWDVVRLSAARAGLPMWLPGTRRPILVRDEPRVAVTAVVDGPSGPFTVCTTHLSFVPGWNRRQLRQVVAGFSGLPEPRVLLGDLNMTARPAARVSGLLPLAAAPTFPVHRPRRQLDHVLAGGGLRATGPVEAPRLPLSDHRALVVPCGPN
ncbi:endonuclease/exonuclease/phosphatase family protein [Blastococcus tunisiensis]|uniref:Metal-dependent hydrolase, endonuclease/exonuclease/phosphatase family n=1 Tax=Blastococcus tunisiensis TaxID=1798228 RepID=A0A1I1Y4R8_9ACTN|nr:endonuclease/exonuclease/phosphatase family protein [Blastococcus sp. DSM 46838]SFE14302.1 Metal-dependent hydrolase, endonuclease/exonuclease/phosphatase family [Blastococcus sp. DSM 46838]